MAHATSHNHPCLSQPTERLNCVESHLCECVWEGEGEGGGGGRGGRVMVVAVLTVTEPRANSNLKLSHQGVVWLIIESEPRCCIDTGTDTHKRGTEKVFFFLHAIVERSHAGGDELWPGLQATRGGVAERHGQPGEAAHLSHLPGDVHQARGHPALPAQLVQEVCQRRLPGTAGGGCGGGSLVGVGCPLGATHFYTSDTG